MTAHQILGVPAGADAATIKKAFRKLAMKYHPDRGGDAEQFKRINSAYESLMRPDHNGRGRRSYQTDDDIWSAMRNATRAHEHARRQREKDAAERRHREWKRRREEKQRRARQAASPEQRRLNAAYKVFKMTVDEFRHSLEELRAKCIGSATRKAYLLYKTGIRLSAKVTPSGAFAGFTLWGLGGFRNKTGQAISFNELNLIAEMLGKGYTHSMTRESNMTLVRFRRT